MKPALTWTIASGGFLLLAGAMAWATQSLMGMERNQQRMEAEAAVQERARPALWRMESIAASLVVEKSARPPDQYRAAPAHAPPVSPASRIRLHFELDSDGRVRAPQAAAGPEKPTLPDEPGLRLQELHPPLPIRFLPGPLEIPVPPFWSPLKLSPATAWGCVLLASAAVAMVLRGMMLLSGRRAAFVSAVTDEPRTPLATFKLYSGMLADGLVKDPAKRQSYLESGGKCLQICRECRSARPAGISY